MTPYSAAAVGRRDKRSSSRRACFSASSGIFASSIFLRNSSTSAACSSFSPSSFWMAFICSRRKYSRWTFSISPRASFWIFWPSCSTSASRTSRPTSFSSLSATEFKLQDLLGVLHVHALEIGDGIGGLERVLHRGNGAGQLLREGGDHLGDLLELVAGIAGQGIDLHALFDVFRGQLDVGLEIRLLLDELAQAEAVHALHQQADGAIRGAEQAVDDGHRARPYTGRRDRAFPARG